MARFSSADAPSFTHIELALDLYPKEPRLESSGSATLRNNKARPKADGTPGDAPEDLAMEGDPTFEIPLHFEPNPDDIEADLAEARRLDAEALASKNNERGNP